ncbi:galactokinase [Geodermatophilus sp. YIM 151500]|uniref:galactokinase n=1 Tax=Geodermatophilus sp. YIM 151500 TaxID=2984531 RepID=UPI0021E50DBE|nr:galactokinase [Geodermatophilus sp. YIM 151500]MCV2488908.1 galactokinase [Geodermatophilus sp. YIM 151500]
MRSDDHAAARARDAFLARFGAEPEGVWAAPGRVNVIGEHTDYNGGFVLPVALPHTTRAAVARRRDGRLVLGSLQDAAGPVEVPLTDLAPGVPPGWGAYPAGVVAELREAVTAAGGVTVLVDGDVPLGAGLSSSAALECAVALALRDVLELDLAATDLVDVARRAENDHVGAPTGILDQSAAMLCREGHALFLDTRDRSAEQVPFDLAATGLALLVVDSGVTHDHAEGGYGDRRRECEEAARRLGVRLLREVDDVGRVDELADGSAEGQVLARRARHVVTEDTRVLAVVDALRSGADPRSIGPVLTAGHASLRDDFEISVPALDAIVDTALAAGAHGARMVGGGFGGSALALVDADRVDAVVTSVTERFATEHRDPPRTFTAVPSAGARRIA